MGQVRLSRKQGVILVGICIMVSLILFEGCLKKENQSEPEATERELELTTWFTDWQWKQALEDFRSLTNSLTSVQVFAAYFDHTDQLFYTKENLEALPKIMELASESSLVHVDLTIVNDWFKEDGSTVQKDSTLITRLLSTPESRKAHIDDIMDMISHYDFRGVEIDYEKISDDDWDHVCTFYEELYERLNGLGKTLRIVLEPRTPIEKLNLPKGPDYVMMAYNLYGNHSGPGPKADHAFLVKMVRKMKQLPGEHYIALATGGFAWPQEGKVIALTEHEATELAKKSLNPPKRDEASSGVYFDYLDDKNKKHTVWYADHITLSPWINVLKQAGYYKIALWRIGGFEQETLDFLNQ